MTVKATKKAVRKNKKPTTFLNPETDPDADRKPTFEKNIDPDPDRLPKVHPA
jgi:hypothetical protein